MTSLGSNMARDFELDQRHRPRAQVEKFPEPSSFSGPDGPSSFRANFLPPDVDFFDLEESDAIRYGSLRDGMSFSPMFSSFEKVDQRALYQAGEKQQRLRRKLLRGSTVLIVQGGYSGKRFIYEKLRDLQVKLYMMDGPDSCWRDTVEDGLFEDFFEIDFTDYESVFVRAMEIIADTGVAFDGVTTYYEDAVPLAARIASALGIEVNPVLACDRARSKQITRQVLKEKGVATPKFASITGPKDVMPACDAVGFPAVLKPSFGASSLGVYKVTNEDEAMTAFNKAMEIMKPDLDTIWVQGTELILEEFYDGDEFDIDILLFDGMVVYSKVSDNWACCAPWFVETGTNCPSLFPASKQEKLKRLAIDSTVALGFKYGAFHVECKYTSRGPRLIEVNARMGGVSVRDCNLIAWGVDLIEEHMMAVLKIPIKPVIPRTPLKFFAEAAINAPYSGTINSDTWLEFARALPGVRDIRYLKKKGDEVEGPIQTLPSWIAEIIVVSEKSAKDAVGTLRRIIEKEAKAPITPTIAGSECSLFFPSHAHPFTSIEDE
eukprot:Plantae.Rhodophyta-Hildenbrandia_rubra.ctg7318.p1 GENE.Plantae.Rhodophyta-Hildenbrandia_rubra.ctg7318~~Plantae.Rhodophyta-Hildenbrandia_rubra.ctg7318.p1  ORF type:complete len:547 (+),score=108.91 Plantae.Rhodophyta-Hildenbrandia_rubra.ctg7318:928-2568(+)